MCHHVLYNASRCNAAVFTISIGVGGPCFVQTTTYLTNYCIELCMFSFLPLAPISSTCRLSSLLTVYRIICLRQTEIPVRLPQWYQNPKWIAYVLHSLKLFELVGDGTLHPQLLSCSDLVLFDEGHCLFQCWEEFKSLVLQDIVQGCILITCCRWTSLFPSFLTLSLVRASVT